MNSYDLNIKINALPQEMKQQLNDFIDYLIFKKAKSKSSSIVRESDVIYKLNSVQKDAVRKARKQIDTGDFSTSEEVFNKIDKWLAKK